MLDIFCPLLSSLFLLLVTSLCLSFSFFPADRQQAVSRPHLFGPCLQSEQSESQTYHRLLVDDQYLSFSSLLLLYLLPFVVRPIIIRSAAEAAVPALSFCFSLCCKFVSNDFHPLLLLLLLHLLSSLGWKWQ